MAALKDWKGKEAMVPSEKQVTQGEFYAEFKFIFEKDIVRTFNPSLGTPFGAYAFERLEQRYGGKGGVLDRLKEFKHDRQYDTEGKDIQYEAAEDRRIKDIESQDMSPAAEMQAKRDAAARNKTKKEVKKEIEISRLRTEIGILSENLVKAESQKADIFRSSEGALMKTKSITEKGFEQSLTENTKLTHYYRLAKILTREKMIEYKDVILSELTIPQLVQMQSRRGELFIKKHGRHGSMEVIEDFMFGENKSGKNPGNKKLLPEMKKLWDVFSKMTEIDRINTPEFKEFYRRKDAGVNVYERISVEDAIWKNFLEPPLTKASQKKFDKVYEQELKKGVSETVAYEKALDVAEVGSGKRGTTREALLYRLSEKMTIDALPEMLTPEFIEKYAKHKGIMPGTHKMSQMEAKFLINQFVNKLNLTDQCEEGYCGI